MTEFTFGANLLPTTYTLPDGVSIHENKISMPEGEKIQDYSPQSKTDLYQLPDGRCLKHQLWDFQQVTEDENDYICLDPCSFSEVKEVISKRA